RRERTTAGAHEDQRRVEIAGLRMSELDAHGEILRERLTRRLSEWYAPLFAPFAEDPHAPLRERQSRQRETRCFRDPESAAVEKLEQSPVPTRDRLRPRWGQEKLARREDRLFDEFRGEDQRERLVQL